jgi:hypothetical protein
MGKIRGDIGRGGCRKEAWHGVQNVYLTNLNII